MKTNPNLNVSPSRFPLSTSSPAQWEPAVCGRSLLLCPPPFSSPGTTSPVPAAPRCGFVPSSRVHTHTHRHTDAHRQTPTGGEGGGCLTPPRPNPRERHTSKRGRKGAIRSTGRDPPAPRGAAPRTHRRGGGSPSIPSPLTGGRAVEDAEVVGPGAAVVGGGAVVPHHDHLLGALEAAYGAHMALAAILLPPLPVRAADHPGPDSFHHHSVVPQIGRAHV